MLLGSLAALLLVAGMGSVTHAADGIAASYPGDVGIDRDPRVIFAERFEGSDFDQWTEVKNRAGLALVNDPENVHSGRQSLQMTARLGQDTGAHLFKRFDTGYDDVYARFYVKFAEDIDAIHHFFMLVAEKTSEPWPSGGAGLRPAGDAKFTTELGPSTYWGRFPPPGAWHFYSYWWQMKRSPDGKYWGNTFLPENPVVPEPGRWYSVEFRLKANTGDDANGLHAFWIDGEKIAEFGGIRWRATDALKINAFWLLFYVTDRVTSNPVSRIYVDDVVIATDYIGPQTQ